MSTESNGNGKRKSFGVAEIMITGVLILGGIVTAFYFEDRKSWHEERRQQEVDQKLLEVSVSDIRSDVKNLQNDMRYQMEHMTRDNEETNKRIERVWQKYDELRERVKR